MTHPTVIYLDHNATTPVDPEVAAVMHDFMTTEFANPASKHAAGLAVKSKVELARRQVASLVGTARKSVTFTSGATESAAIALRAVTTNDRPRILLGATEHRAVFEAAEASGAIIELVRVRTDGLLDTNHLDSLLADDVAVVAVMAANNETGVVNDVGDIAERAHSVGALMLSDVTQLLGKLPVHLDTWGVDIALASAHKLYAPKGIGMLSLSPAARRRVTLPWAGTPNTAAIIGFGHAAQLAQQRLDADMLHLRRMRDALFTALRSRTRVAWYGRRAPLVPNTLYVRFPDAPSDAVLSCLPGVAASSGAACSATDDKPSHVLIAMGVEPRPASEAIRFSVGRTTTIDEVHEAAAQIVRAVERVRLLNQPARKKVS